MIPIPLAIWFIVATIISRILENIFVAIVPLVIVILIMS